MPLEGLRQRFAAETGRSRLLLGLALLTIIAFTLYPSHSSSQNSPSIPKEDYTYPAAPHRGAIKQDGPKRAAIIGAGASGSASAFFLNRAARIMEARIGVPERSLLGEIVMFDREGYVGGSE